MGYSCTVAADQMLGLVRHMFTNGKYSNGLTINGRSYFYERGRETVDGAITGTVFENISETQARKAGHFRIDFDGNLIRFPRLTAAQREAVKVEYVRLRRENPSLLNSYSHGVL